PSPAWVMLFPYTSLFRSHHTRQRLPLSFHDGENVVLAHDEVIGAVDLDLGAGVLGEKNPVAHFHRESDPLPVREDATATHRDHLDRKSTRLNSSHVKISY